MTPLGAMDYASMVLVMAVVNMLWQQSRRERKERNGMSLAEWLKWLTDDSCNGTC